MEGYAEAEQKVIQDYRANREDEVAREGVLYRCNIPSLVA